MFGKPTVLVRVLALLVCTLAAAAGAQEWAPEDLRDWRDWILKDKEYRECPFRYNASATSREDFLCVWSGTLSLDVDQRQARFSQSWTVGAREQWVQLPGDMNHWPDQVRANDRPVEVVARQGRPNVRLAAGNWNLTGRFAWDERPGVLRLPTLTGLVALNVDGAEVTRPDINRDTLFLGERQQEDEREVDGVRVAIYRLVADDVPTILASELQVDVSGSVREETFGNVLPEGFVPVGLDSELPAKLEADGTLHLQVRPGRWTVQIAARGSGVADSMRRPSRSANMPGQEIWSFAANNTLRVAAVEGLPPVDPMQVDVPDDWLDYPAFRVDEGAEFIVGEKSRGVVSATNDLTLDRTLWLDFDGSGFVLEDMISGRMRTGWRLDMGGPYSVLSATENGDNLLITEGVGDGLTGIEVRNSDVDVEAIGRIESRSEVPVTGWHSRFANMSATLNLPPGNVLLAAPGVDTAAGSWLGRWQLLDFFMVLIITIAVWRMFGRAAGAIALGALVLTFHEAGAPAWLWLNLLIAIALLRVTPDGRLKQLVTGYQALSALLLLIVLVPFLAGQIRTAIYPQLEPQRYASVFSGFAGTVARTDDEMYDASDELRFSREPKARFAAPESEALEEIVVTGSKVLPQQVFSRYAANAVVQAGPGIPSWQWNSHRLSWGGPIDPDQTMRLVILPRWLVSGIRVIAVALVLLLAGVLAAAMFGRRLRLPGGIDLAKGANAMLVVALIGGTLSVDQVAYAETPDPEILEEYEARLLEPPECVPRCAEIAAADVRISDDAIAIRLTIHALEDVAIPLPGALAGWRPDAVVVDGAGNTRLVRSSDGTLWLRASAGRPTVSLRGAVPNVDSLELPFPLSPRVISVDADGWFVAGVQDRRMTTGSLQLTRLRSEDDGDGSARWESSRFPAFATVHRNIDLDLDWRVRTTVERVAPTQGALTLEIPLVDGESIVSGDFTVRDGKVLVSMNPQQDSVSWVSNLPLTSPLMLQAPDGSSWTEVWRVSTGNVWHASFEGVPESNTGWQAEGVRTATFHPRAGEALTLTTTRPDAVAGNTLAIDDARVTVEEGSRSRTSRLALSYRSTQGSQHSIRLPDGAEVTDVSIDEEPQTLRAVDGVLTLPILPGDHEVVVEWREDSAGGFMASTPAIELGAPVSNINIRLSLPSDRWLLATTGPQMGPAVLYWSELVALVVFTFVLARVKITPLTQRHWLLLGLGFSTFNWFVLILVAAWLVLCGVRANWKGEGVTWWRYNVVQVLVAVVTVVALYNIVIALPAGLLGHPDMHVSGHRSGGNSLGWFADRADSALPVATAVSAPLWVYKGLILAWALWFSFALLRWLPWVWGALNNGGLWRQREKVAAGGATK